MVCKHRHGVLDPALWAALCTLESEQACGLCTVGRSQESRVVVFPRSTHGDQTHGALLWVTFDPVSLHHATASLREYNAEQNRT